MVGESITSLHIQTPVAVRDEKPAGAINGVESGREENRLAARQPGGLYDVVGFALAALLQCEAQIGFDEIDVAFGDLQFAAANCFRLENEIVRGEQAVEMPCPLRFDRVSAHDNQ